MILSADSDGHDQAGADKQADLGFRSPHMPKKHVFALHSPHKESILCV